MHINGRSVYYFIIFSTFQQYMKFKAARYVQSILLEQVILKYKSDWAHVQIGIFSLLFNSLYMGNLCKLYINVKMHRILYIEWYRTVILICSLPHYFNQNVVSRPITIL